MNALGFASAIVPELNFNEVFQLAAEIGYECVEVMCWPPSKAERRYAGITHIDLTKLDATTIDEIHQTVERTGVAISSLGYYPNCLSPDLDDANRAVAHVKLLIESAAKLNVGRVTTFIGRDYTKSVDDNWPRLLETWKPIVELAEKHQIDIGIENCPMLFTKDEWPGGKNIAISPAIWRRLFDDLASPRIGLNYDPSHMVWQRMDYLAPLRDFTDRIFHVHAKDVRVDQHRLDQVGILAHPNEYHTPKIPGLGDVDWGKFFGVLGDSGYQGPVCVEVEDRTFEHSLEGRKDSLRQSCRYLRQYL